MHQTENDNDTMAKSGHASSNSSIDSSNCSRKNNVPPNPSFGRICHIVKRPDFDGYGFNLHSEKVKSGQFIGKVDANSPAEAAGLREGDQIIEVNGVNIGMETHKQVVQRIKAISNEVRLLLIDPITEGLSTNTQSRVNIPEKSTVNSKRSVKITTSAKPLNTMSTTQPNSPPIVPTMEVATTGAIEADQNEFISSISKVSTKSDSTYSNNGSTTNGHRKKTNGQALGPETTILNTSNSPVTTEDQPDSIQQPQQQSANNSPVNATYSKSGLNLNLTAAEMRAKLQAKKKFDPKNDSVDLKKKFDIIQKL